MKAFLEWIGLKEKLNDANHKPPLVSEGDIWWASVGKNIGSEIHGKSDKFSRPVIIYKKLTCSFYFVIPTTTKKRSGTWFASFRHKEEDGIACLHEARSIDHRRLFSKIGTLDDADFSHIKKSFWFLYK